MAVLANVVVHYILNTKSDTLVSCCTHQTRLNSQLVRADVLVSEGNLQIKQQWLIHCHINTQCSMMPSSVTTVTVHCARSVCSMIVSSIQNSVKTLQYSDTRMSDGIAEFSLKATFRFVFF